MTGPTGPTGPTGATGSNGPTGPTGLLGFGTVTPNATITAPTSGNATTTISLVPASPSGTKRGLVTGIWIRLHQALTGAGNVTVRIGTTNGGQEAVLDFVIDSSSTGPWGLDLAELGSAFDSDTGMMVLDAGASLYVKCTASGTVSQAPIIQVFFAGASMGN